MATNNENVNIKVTVDTSNATKNVGSARKEMVELKKSIQDLSMEIKRTGDPTGELTKKLAEMQSQLGSMQDTMSDAMQRARYMADDFAQVKTALQGIGAGIAVFQGITAAAELFGIKNEKALEIIKKLQIAQAALNSVNTIAQALNKDSYLMIGLKIIKEQLLTKVTQANTKAQIANNAAVAATPWGAILAVIGLVIAAITTLTSLTNDDTEANLANADSIDKKREANDRYNKSIMDAEKEWAKQNAMLNEYKKILNETKKSETAHQTAIEGINKILGTHYTETKQAIEGLESYESATTKSREALIKANAEVKKQEELLDSGEATFYDYEKSLAKQAQATYNLEVNTKKWNDANNAVIASLEKLNKLQEESTKIQKRGAAIDKENAKLRIDIRNLEIQLTDDINEQYELEQTNIKENAKLTRQAANDEIKANNDVLETYKTQLEYLETIQEGYRVSNDELMKFRDEAEKAGDWKSFEELNNQINENQKEFLSNEATITAYKKVIADTETNNKKLNIQIGLLNQQEALNLKIAEKRYEQDKKENLNRQIELVKELAGSIGLLNVNSTDYATIADNTAKSVIASYKKTKDELDILKTNNRDLFDESQFDLALTGLQEKTIKTFQGILEAEYQTEDQLIQFYDNGGTITEEQIGNVKKYYETLLSTFVKNAKESGTLTEDQLKNMESSLQASIDNQITLLSKFPEKYKELVLRRQLEIQRENFDREVALQLELIDLKLESENIFTEEYENLVLKRLDWEKSAEEEYWKRKFEDGIINAEQYQEALREVEEKYEKKRQKTQKSIDTEKRETALSAALEIGNGLLSISSSLQDAELEAAGENEKKKLEIKKRYAIADLVLGAIKSASELAITIPKTIEAYAGIPFVGPVLAAVQIAAATASIIAQIAKINNMKSQVSSAGAEGYAEDGDFVVGRRHSQGGVLYQVEDGEAIINRRAMAIPEYRSLASAINESTGGKRFPGTNGASLMTTLDENSLQKIVNAVAAIPVVVTEKSITKAQRNVRVIKQTARI